jgi:RNA polymerase sigma-70 factor (ECF subfamily)
VDISVLKGDEDDACRDWNEDGDSRKPRGDRMTARKAGPAITVSGKHRLSPEAETGELAIAADAAFDRLTRERRNDIRVHCYRIMGSLSDAEDLTQETFARAWRSRGDLVDPASMRSWLYRIATNACLDALRRRKRDRRLWSDPAPLPTGDFAELGVPDIDIGWLEPMPDSMLCLVADDAPNPHARYELAESVRLAFLACVQALPARQRAIFLLCEVLGWSAAEAASAFAITPQAVNSLLQRARRTFDAAYRGKPEWAAASNLDQQVAERYAAAFENRDLDGLVSLLRTDATMQMPPWRGWVRGRDAIGRFSGQAMQRWNSFSARQFRVNGQSAVILYARAADSDAWRPHSLNVLEVAEGALASVVAYAGPLAPTLFASTGIPLQP